MSVNGERIQDYLEIFQHEVSVGCAKEGHRYSQNGTISCIVCGEIKSK